MPVLELQVKELRESIEERRRDRAEIESMTYALRDRLVAAILCGAKTATAGLVLENEPLAGPGQLLAVVDSADRRVAAIELTQVRVIRLADVDVQHALDEGQGDESVAQWRSGHEEFWHSAEVRAELDDPHFTVNDDTLVLALSFHWGLRAGRCA